MNPCWLIFLELPKGTFVVEQLNAPFSCEELDKDVRDAFHELRHPPLPTCQPVQDSDQNQNISQDAILPPTKRLLLGHFHTEYVMIEICNKLSQRNADPIPPWSEHEVAEVQELF